MSKPIMWDARTLEMMLEELEEAFPMPDRLNFDVTSDQIVRLGIARSAKYEILSVIREKILRLRKE